VEVGEKNLAGAQHFALSRLRLLNLNDHIGAVKNILCEINDFGPRLLILRVVKANRLPAIELDHDLMAILHQLLNTPWGEANSVLVIFYFLGDANQHVSSPVHE
jgi:hypothetical protein